MVLRMTSRHKTGRPKSKPARKPSAPPTPTNAELDLIIEDALTDAYDEYEQVGGFFCVLKENVTFPFETTLLGMPVTVTGVEDSEDVVLAVVRRGKHEQKISLEELPLPNPLPAGGDYLLAYRRWRGVK
jgi:hypothetical protein